MFSDKDFVVKNTVKNGQSWCSAVICRKRSVFDMQFHLVVVSIFLKTCVKRMFIQVQPLTYTLVDTIFFNEKGTPFVYLLMTNGTPFTYLV